MINLIFIVIQCQKNAVKSYTKKVIPWHVKNWQEGCGCTLNDALNWSTEKYTESLIWQSQCQMLFPCSKQQNSYGGTTFLKRPVYKRNVAEMLSAVGLLSRESPARELLVDARHFLYLEVAVTSVHLPAVKF